MQYILKLYKSLSNYSDQMLINILFTVYVTKLCEPYFDATNKSKK
jgi:hypothetical protein